MGPLDRTSTVDSAPAGPPVAGEVVVASLVLVTAIAPILVTLPHDRLSFDAALPLIGWFPIGVVGVVLIDQRRSWLGPVCLAVATVPLLLLGVAFAVDASTPSITTLAAALAWLGPLTIAPLLGFAAALLAQRQLDRAARRWRFWLVACSIATVVGASGAWHWSGGAAYGALAIGGLCSVAGIAAACAAGAIPRPIDEPLLDVGLLLGVAAVSAMSGLSMRWLATHEELFGADTVGPLAAAAATAMAVPGARWVRARTLEQRYGSGSLSPTDLDLIASELDGPADPRALLSKAAAVVQASTGLRDARIYLDDVPPSNGWEAYPLLGTRGAVGTLCVRSPHAEGLEARQERVVNQLLPTIGLLTRGVVLALASEDARADLARERIVERERILTDLHDDLGPVLAGMSMRLAVARARFPDPDLDALAEDLSRCRSDLRRIVAGLAPHALEQGDLAAAVDALVGAFATSDRPVVRLEGTVPAMHDAEARVVVYRTIAEGLTNAVRHADADQITVRPKQADTGFEVAIVDDGVGGPVVPSVGLTSLQKRAVAIGGTLEIVSGRPSGTSLVLHLPGPPR